MIKTSIIVIVNISGQRNKTLSYLNSIILIILRSHNKILLIIIISQLPQLTYTTVSHNMNTFFNTIFYIQSNSLFLLLF